MIALNTTEWNVHEASGHCRHNSGADAYFDVSGQHGYEIPLIGPFGNSKLGSTELGNLVSIIESIHPHKFVVWGVSTASETPREATFMGVDTFWQPDYSLRLHFLRPRLPSFADIRVRVPSILLSKTGKRRPLVSSGAPQNNGRTLHLRGRFGFARFAYIPTKHNCADQISLT